MSELVNIFGGKKIIPERAVALEDTPEATTKGTPRKAEYMSDEEAKHAFRTPGAATGMDHIGSDFNRKSGVQQKRVSNTESLPSVQDSVPSSMSSESLSSTPSTSSPDSEFLLQQQRGEYVELGKRVRELENQFAVVDAQEISPEQAKEWSRIKSEIQKAKMAQEHLGKAILEAVKASNKN